MVKLKLKAFSLFESVVAIAIISVCIGVGSLIYSNIMGSDSPVITLQCQEEMTELFEKLKSEKKYFTHQFQYDGFVVDQEVQPYQRSKRLLLITYRASSAGKTLAQEMHIILNQELRDESF